MALVLKRGKPREFEEKGIDVTINEGAGRQLIRVDAVFRVLEENAYADMIRGGASDHEAAVEITARVDAPKVEMQDEQGEKIEDADEITALLLSQPEIQAALIRKYGERIKGPGGPRRKN